MPRSICLATGPMKTVTMAWVAGWLLLSCLGPSNCLAQFSLRNPNASSRPALTTQEKPTTITLIIAPDSRGALGSQQKWMQALQNVGASRVTSGLGGGAAEASIDEKENTSSISIRVKGFIDKGKLVLPGGKFSIRETKKIKALLDGFRKDGAEVTLSEKKAFGLTAKQLVWLHNQLTVKVDISTKGQDLGKVINALTAPVTENSQIKFVQDKSARRALAGAELVNEELKGLSTGTALAAILRPVGLVLEPVHVRANEIELHIKDTRASDEHWPVGWPPKIPPVRAEPKLFTKMPIQIRNVPLDKVMAALQQKADVPFLYDQNTMAREGIEMDKTKVDLSEKNGALAVVADRLLRQTRPRMSSEIRVDEAGKGFLWITVR